MQKLVLACLAVLLWGCDTPRGHGPDTPYYRFPPDSRLTLNRALEIPAGWATARIQNGRVVPFGQVEEYLPHCIFEIGTVRETPQRVEPDTFAIVRVERSESTLAAASSGLFLFVGNAWADPERPSQMFYKTVFILRSARQPGVRRLTCQSDQYAAGVGIPRHLTVPEIRRALGDLFTLELPGA